MLTPTFPENLEKTLEKSISTQPQEKTEKEPILYELPASSYTSPLAEEPTLPPKQPSTIRIVFQNVNGIPTSNQHPKNDSL